MKAELKASKMQRLVLLPAPSRQAQDEENIGVGAVKPLDYPYNLFLNLEELLDPDRRFVYFFAYVLGKLRIVLWGAYDKERKEFHFDGSCRYRTDQLHSMVNTWRREGQTYVANVVRNRPAEILDVYLEGKRMTYPEYLRLKFILAYFDGEISYDELETRYPGSYESFVDEAGINPLEEEHALHLYDYIEEVAEKVKKYEGEVNRRDVNKSLNMHVQAVVGKIAERFEATVQTGSFQSSLYYGSLRVCPDKSECDIREGEGCEAYYYGRRYFNPEDIV